MSALKVSTKEELIEIDTKKVSILRPELGVHYNGQKY